MNDEINKYSEEYQDNIIKNVKFTDDKMFTSVVSDKSIAIDLIRILTGVHLNSEIDIDTSLREYTINNVVMSKGVRYDVYVQSTNEVFDIEIQNINTGNLPERTRYYQGIMDVDFLKSGHDYKELKTSYIIFVCNFNPYTAFQSNKPIYIVNSTITDGIETYRYNDRMFKIFVNAECNINDIDNLELKSFIELIKDGYDSETYSDIVDKIKSKMQYLKISPKWRKEYMLEYERLEQVRREGIEQGMAQSIPKTIKILKSLSLSETNIIDNICSEFDITREKAQEYLDSL